MGLLSSILGFFGFGLGTSIGLVIGYYMFIYFQPSDVKVCFSFLFFCSFCLWKTCASSTDPHCHCVLCVGILF